MNDGCRVGLAFDIAHDVVDAHGQVTVHHRAGASDDGFDLGGGGHVGRCRHASQHALQNAHIGAAIELHFGHVLGHCDLVGQQRGGSAPHGICWVLGSQVGEDLVHDVTARPASVQGADDVCLGFCLGCCRGAGAHDVVDQSGGELLAREERGVSAGELRLGGVDVDDLLGRQAGVVSVADLGHVFDARSRAEGDNEELIRFGLLLIGHCH